MTSSPGPVPLGQNQFMYVQVYMCTLLCIPVAADLPAPGLGPRDLEPPGPPGGGDVSLGSAPG